MINTKEKIKKLLSLAKSANENEAKDALLKAKELMVKYKLSEKDFEDVKKQELKHYRCDDVKFTTDSGKIWMADLCNLICENHLCVSSWGSTKGCRTYTLVITGMEEDVEVCKEIIRYAVGFVENAIDMLCRKKRGNSAQHKSIGTSYAKGFINGLELAYELQQDKHPDWGLVLVQPEKVKQYADSLGTKNVKTKQTDFDPMAYTIGQEDGKNFNNRRALQGCQ